MENEATLAIDLNKAIALTELRPMEPALVADLDANAEELTRLKHLGICAGRRLQMVKPGDPLILRVLGSRIGLSVRLGSCVSVVRCRDTCEH